MIQIIQNEHENNVIFSLSFQTNIRRFSLILCWTLKSNQAQTSYYFCFCLSTEIMHSHMCRRVREKVKEKKHIHWINVNVYKLVLTCIVDISLFNFRFWIRFRIRFEWHAIIIILIKGGNIYLSAVQTCHAQCVWSQTFIGMIPFPWTCIALPLIFRFLSLFQFNQSIRSLFFLGP